MSKTDGKLHRRGGLTLRRKVGEGIIIDKDIDIEIVQCSEGYVHLSIRAPGHSVLRKEIAGNQPREKQACNESPA